MSCFQVVIYKWWYKQGPAILSRIQNSQNPVFRLYLTRKCMGEIQDWPLCWRQKSFFFQISVFQYLDHLEFFMICWHLPRRDCEHTIYVHDIVWRLVLQLYCIARLSYQTKCRGFLFCVSMFTRIYMKLSLRYNEVFTVIEPHHTKRALSVAAT